jgi:FkbM family methyltransferase
MISGLLEINLLPKWLKLMGGVTSILSKVIDMEEKYLSKFEIWYINEKVKYSVDSSGAIGKKSLRELLGSNPKIVEVGAHIGVDTQEFSRIFPEGIIYAFEAHPSLYAVLQKKCKYLENVKCLNLALSNKIGFSIFRQSSGASSGSGSLLTPTSHLARHPEVLFLPEDELIVPTLTLDSYFEFLQGFKIDLMWIDVQGAERIVLEGAIKCLEVTRFIYLEVSKIPLYEGAVAYEELKSYLRTLGFHVEREFLPDNWHGEGNVLFRKVHV